MSVIRSLKSKRASDCFKISLTPVCKTLALCKVLPIFLRTKLKFGYVCKNSIHFSCLKEEPYEKKRKEHKTVLCAMRNLQFVTFFFLVLIFFFAFQEWFYKSRLFWPLDMPSVICSCCSPICKGHNNMCCKFEGFLVQCVLNLGDHQAC